MYLWKHHNPSKEHTQHPKYFLLTFRNPAPFHTWSPWPSPQTIIDVCSVVMNYIFLAYKSTYVFKVQLELTFKIGAMLKVANVKISKRCT